MDIIEKIGLYLKENDERGVDWHINAYNKTEGHEKDRHLGHIRTLTKGKGKKFIMGVAKKMNVKPGLLEQTMYDICPECGMSFPKAKRPGEKCPGCQAALETPGAAAGAGAD